MSTIMKRLGGWSEWEKSPLSQNGAQCVEVRMNRRWVEVRDTKLGNKSPVHRYTYREWDVFIDAVKCGKFQTPRGWYSGVVRLFVI